MAVAAIAAGTALSAYGTIKSNQDEAQALQNNADYYKEQAGFAQATGTREEDVFYQRSRQTMAQQQGAYAAGGVDASGSTLFVAEDQYLRQEKERTAIRAMTAQKVLMANTKGDFAQQRADEMGSFGYNFLTVAPTLLRGGGAAYGASAGGGNPSSGGVSA